MITQSLLIKTAHSYRNELIDLLINKGFIGPDSRYEGLPYILISTIDDMKMFIPVKEAKGKQVYYVHPKHFDAIRLIPVEAVIEFIKSIQT